MTTDTPEALAALLRAAADRLEHPPIEPGRWVRYASQRSDPVEAWRRRDGRMFLAVEGPHGDDDMVAVWVPRSHADDDKRHDFIHPTAARLDVIVPPADVLLAAILRLAAERIVSLGMLGEGGDLLPRFAEYVELARAILGAADGGVTP